MEKSEKVTLLSLIILFGFSLAVIFHYSLAFYFYMPFPYSTFLYNPTEVFTDLTDAIAIIKSFAPYDKPNVWIMYFPLAYILLLPLTFIKSKLILVLTFELPFILFFVWENFKNLFCKNLSKVENFQNIFIIALMSYPFLMLLDRANFDAVLFIFFSAFVYTFKEKKILLSAVILGLMNALKPFFLVFYFLFIFQKRYKELIYSFIISILLIFGGFIFFKGNFFDQIFVYLQNLILYEKKYFLNLNGGLLGCSNLFMGLKAIFCNSLNLISTEKLLIISNYIGFCLTLISLFFTRREKVFWKRIMFLTLLILLIPGMVNDYKLIFLFVPLWLFINTQEKTKFDIFYTFLIGLLLIPKNSIIVPLAAEFKVVVFSMILNPLIILSLLGLMIYEQFYSQRKVEGKNG